MCIIRTSHNLIALALLLFSAATHADESNGWQCWQEASTRYSVPVDLLYAIARVETGNRSSIVSRANNDRSYDIGLMQINSYHLPMLSKYGITERKLISDACLNLNIGAWILSGSIARNGFNWRAVGAYNAGTESKRIVYAKKVFAMYERIKKERNSTQKIAEITGSE
jgi:soluble lytic murein transglycosylase-like protein